MILSREIVSKKYYKKTTTIESWSDVSERLIG
jgi:hypothetical protein